MESYYHGKVFWITSQWQLFNKTTGECIRGFPLASANYHKAVEVLKKPNGNKQISISFYMDTLVKLTKAVNIKI